MMMMPWLQRGGAILVCAALISVVLIVALRPLLARYALARPNARSSHKVPTPQGGGIAVIAATIVAAYGTSFFLTGDTATAIVFAAAVLIACVGAIDDIRPIAVGPRLLLQTLAIVTMIYALPADLRAIPILPWWLERALLVVGGLWFVNLVNFMDGLDWMTVAEVVPVTAALAAIGLLGVLPVQATLVAFALCGRDDRLCLVQPPGGEAFSGRRPAAFPSGCCSAGCCSCSLQPAAVERRQSSCRFIISPTARSRWFGE